MRNIKYLFSLVLVLFLFTNSFGQQETTITNYWSHMNIINPAYAGSDNNINWKSTLRNQWSGIADAPETQMFSFSSPLGKNVGMGMSIVNDKVFIENSTYVAFDFSYKLKVSERANLYFGLKAAAQFFSINPASLETFNVIGDPSLSNIDNSYPNLGIGFLLKRENWYLSVSTPRMLNTERVSMEQEVATMATDKPHLYVSSGYQFDLKNNWSITPSFLLSTVKDVPVLYDFNLLASYDELLSLGFTYRNTKTYAGILSFKVSNNFTVGYAYETSSRTILSNEWNSSEIFLGYTVPFKNRRGQEIDDDIE